MRVGRLTVLLDRLNEVIFIHRALAHIAGGWIAKIPDLAVKCELARHAYEDLHAAHQLSGHATALRRGDDPAAEVPAGTADAMRAIDAAPTADLMLVAMYGVARRHLFLAYDELGRTFDVILDGSLLYAAQPAIELLRRQLAYGQKVLESRLRSGADAFAQGIEQAFLDRRAGSGKVELARALWAPLDRVPAAVRPPGMARARPGAMRLLPLDSGRDRHGQAIFFHNLINGEYTTLELVSRSAYEHPELPAAFHLHMARQAADESRHARALEAALEKLGHRYGDFPSYTLTYDGYYAFEPCAAGGKRELLWRLLVRGTIDEGLALDDFAFQIERREYLGQAELADLFRYLIADETFHAQSALKWSRHLCEGDEERVREERAQANVYVNRMLDERRRDFVAKYPKEAMAELAHKRQVASLESKDPLPLRRTLNTHARKAAGFTDQDLAQVVEWGYAPRVES